MPVPPQTPCAAGAVDTADEPDVGIVITRPSALPVPGVDDDMRPSDFSHLQQGVLQCLPPQRTGKKCVLWAARKRSSFYRQRAESTSYILLFVLVFWGVASFQ